VYHGNVRSLNRRDFEFGSSFNAQSPDLEERVPRLHPAEMNFVTRELCVRGIPFVEFLIKNGTSDTAVEIIQPQLDPPKGGGVEGRRKCQEASRSLFFAIFSAASTSSLSNADDGQKALSERKLALTTHGPLAGKLVEFSLTLRRPFSGFIFAFGMIFLKPPQYKSAPLLAFIKWNNLMAGS